MRVFIFSSVHIWNDTRIFHKQATSLAKHHEVELHAPAEFQFKEINGIKIYGLPLWQKVKDRKNIRREIWKRIRKSSADIYHFHDPELLWIAVKAKIFYRKCMIYDVHEHYPRAILDKNWIIAVFRIPISLIFDLYERVCSRLLSGVIYTTRIIGKRFSPKHSICISNYPLISMQIDTPYVKKKDQLIYVGGITKIRGFIELLKALKFLIKSKYSDMKLVVVGRYFDIRFEKEVNNLIDDLNLSNNIQFLGHLPYFQIMPLIAESMVGIVTYLPYSNNIVCLPNKLFEYMSCGTAVLASNFELYEEIINEARCGLVVDPSQPVDIAEKLDKMLSNPKELRTMGENGKNSILKRYNWNFEEEKLLKFYSFVLKNSVK